jgi:hypothetical protein
MPHKLLGLSSIFFLFACVSSPQHIELTEPPISAPFPEGGGKAEVVVVQDAFMGFAFAFGVHVNGRKIGQLRIDDYVHTSVEPGMVHILVTSETDCNATFPVLADRSYFLRAEPMMGWSVPRAQLELLDPEEGREARDDCDDKTIGAGGAEVQASGS